MTEQEIEQIVTAVTERLSAVLRNPPPERGCFTVEEAAAFVRCSTAHIRREISRGHLPAANIGRAEKQCLRVMRADLMSWLEQRKSGAFNVPSQPARGAMKAPVLPYRSRHWQQSPESPSESHAV